MMAHHHSKNIDTEKEILAAFEACDRKKTGEISREELQHYMMETGDKLTKMECKLVLSVNNNNNNNRCFQDRVTTPVAKLLSLCISVSVHTNDMIDTILKQV